MKMKNPLRDADTVIFQNPDDRKAFAGLGLTHARQTIEVVNGSGVDLERFRAAPMPEGPPTFLMIARLLRDKGVYEYVEAARLVKRDHKAARFWLLGPIDPNPAAVKPADVDAWVREGVIDYGGAVDDVRPYGGIPLSLLQKYLNFHYSVSLDLFGSEVSTNAANFYTMGLKGRFEEEKRNDDHRLQDATYPVTILDGDRIITREEPALPSLNERLRDDYIADCQRGVDRWNRIIRAQGIDAVLRLPHRGFHRAIGGFAEARVSPDGRVVRQAEWDARHADWLPTEAERAFVIGLMQPVTGRGQFAGWIAPPARGINGQPVDFEYVRREGA